MYNNRNAGQVGNAIQATSDSPAEPTASNDFLASLDYINTLLGDLLNSQSAQLDRLFGPKPESPTSGVKGDASPQGSLGAIHSMLSAVKTKCQCALDMQNQLSKVG